MLTLLMVKTLGTHRVYVKTGYFHNKTSQNLHVTGVETFIIYFDHNSRMSNPAID